MSGGSDGPPDLSASDYEAIEAAVMETERGRWFLAEFARRQRAAETQMLLEAIKKLEAAVALPTSQAAPVADLFAQDEDLFDPPAAAPNPPPERPALKLDAPAEAPPPELNRVVVIHRSTGESVDIPLAAAAMTG